MKSSAGDSVITGSPLTQRALQAFSFLTDSTTHLGIAVSGGSDSMALLMLAADYRDSTGVTISAATVDHGLRPEAQDEALFVARVCDDLGIPHEILRWERQTDDPATQERARQARHRLLAQWAARARVGRIALGHTRDDRIETFLMRARQGSGWHGLSGLLPESPSPVWPEGRGVMLVRPLLAFGREDLRADLRTRDVRWVDDPSNDAVRFERVRMRRLAARMDPAACEKALRVMDRLIALRVAVMKEASGLVSQVEVQDERTAEIPLERRGRVAPESWLRFVEAMVMAGGGAKRAPRREALDRLLAEIAGDPSRLERGVTLAGCKIRIRKGGILAFSQAPQRRGAPPGSTAGWDRAAALLRAPDLRSLRV